MHDVLLTPEEIQKRKELFEYEMTQVVMNLNGKFAKYDRKKSPIELSQELADEVLDSRIDYDPIIEVDLNVDEHIIPPIDKKLGYDSFENVSPNVKIIANEQKLASIKNTVQYTRLENLDVKHLSCDVPDRKEGIEYEPFTTKEVPTMVVNGLMNEIFEIRGTDYAPMAGTKVEFFSASIPDGKKAVEYSSFSSVLEGIQISDVTIPKILVEYFAASIPEIEKLGQEIPRTKAEIVYSPLQVLAVGKINAVTPNLYKAPKRNYFRALPVQKIKIDIPKMGNAVNYTSLASLEARGLEHTVPHVKTAVEYTSTAIQAEQIPRFAAPKIVTATAYKPQKQRPVKRVVKTIPKTQFDVELSFEKPKKNKVSPIDSLPEGILEPNDFYAMWESL